ncbi:MAG: nucleoside triphosphate pyrophosphohydrolase [Rhodospirillales bacterium]|nr:nucleoside triphosphate pyrophosphohydrolase [Rhodospirillales bacterium]
MSAETDRLLAIMAKLRDPNGGCPWDVAQSFPTIAPYTIEEAYEVADAIERKDMPGLEEELGDLLLQVVFHAQMAHEAGLFDYADVARGISEKLIRRHPHVFADVKVASAEAQTKAWEDHKAGERRAKAAGSDQPVSALDGVPLALPALTRALKIQKRAERAGFDWRTPKDVLAKFEEEVAEVAHEMESHGSDERLMDEIGDLLFTCVNLARKLGVDPEDALRHGNRKFDTRFRRMETVAAAEGQPLADRTYEGREALWNRAKREV